MITDAGFGIPVVDWRRARYAAGFSAEDARAAVAAHRRCLAGGPGVLAKNDANSRVTIVATRSGREVCVKESCWRGAAHRLKDLFRPAPVLREWINSRRLQEAGVPAAVSLAVLPASLFQRGSSSFLIQEVICDAERVDVYVFRTSRDRPKTKERKRRLIREFALWLRDLHQREIAHRDLKPSNILVCEEAANWKFYLIDLADISIGRHVSRRLRVLNLAQLNASMPIVVTPTDRLRFLHWYADGIAELEPLQRTWEDALRITRTRRCVWEGERPIE